MLVAGEMSWGQFDGLKEECDWDNIQHIENILHIENIVKVKARLNSAISLSANYQIAH